MDKSTNLQLNLPKLTDVADVTKLSDNFVVIDQYVKNLHDEIEALKSRVAVLESKHQ